jgi:hypothetical protein
MVEFTLLDGMMIVAIFVTIGLVNGKVSFDKKHQTYD